MAGLIAKERVQQIRKSDSELLNNMSTGKGHSGSPIIAVNLDGEYIVIGIHKGGVNTKIQKQKQTLNIGVLFNHGLVEILQYQTKEMKGDPFVLAPKSLKID